MTKSEEILYKELGTDWWLMINEQPYFHHVLQAISKALDQGRNLPISDVSKSVCDHQFMNTGCTVQGRSLLSCVKCNYTKQTDY